MLLVFSWQVTGFMRKNREKHDFSATISEK
jgi:hypothetical protein